MLFFLFCYMFFFVLVSSCRGPLAPQKEGRDKAPRTILITIISTINPIIAIILAVILIITIIPFISIIRISITITIFMFTVLNSNF